MKKIQINQIRNSNHVQMNKHNKNKVYKIVEMNYLNEKKRIKILLKNKKIKLKQLIRI